MARTIDRGGEPLGRRPRGSPRRGGTRTAPGAGMALAILVGFAVAVAGPVDAGPPDAPGVLSGSLVADASRVSFRARDPLGGFGGVLPIASASLTFDPRATETARATLALDPAGIDTGNVLRDANAARALLEVRHFPELRFRLERLELSVGTLPEGASSPFDAVGDLTLHGVTSTLEVTGTAERSDGRLVVDVSFPIALTSFGMTPPSFLFVTVDDRVDVTVHLVFALAGTGSARPQGP